MKIKNLNVGDKYLMSVHDFVPTDKEKDPTLSAEILEIISIDGDNCIARGCATKNTYSLTLNEYKKNIISSLENNNHKYERSYGVVNNKYNYYCIGVIIFMIIISALKLIVDVSNGNIG